MDHILEQVDQIDALILTLSEVRRRMINYHWFRKTIHNDILAFPSDQAANISEGLRMVCGDESIKPRIPKFYVFMLCAYLETGRTDLYNVVYSEFNVYLRYKESIEQLDRYIVMCNNKIKELLNEDN